MLRRLTGSSLYKSSAIVNFAKIRRGTWFFVLTVVDVILGLVIWDVIRNMDVVLWWEQFFQLISYLDEIISWLTSNPVGLKLNEPVNLALAGFFRYHIYLWHTFAQFFYTPMILELVKLSLCVGLSCALALSTDLLSILTLHIHCFDVYATSHFMSGQTDHRYGLSYRFRSMFY